MAAAKISRDLEIGKIARNAAREILPARIANSESSHPVQKTGRHASGSAGILPAVRRILRSTRRTSACERTSLDARACSAGCETQQAGCPRYPMHAARFVVRLVHSQRQQQRPRRGASATTIAVGDESSSNPRINACARKPRSGGTRRATPDVVTPLRGLSVLPSCPWVPRRLVTHGYCCFGATRLRNCEAMQPPSLPPRAH